MDSEEIIYYLSAGEGPKLPHKVEVGEYFIWKDFGILWLFRCTGYYRCPIDGDKMPTWDQISTSVCGETIEEMREYVKGQLRNGQ